MNIELSRIKLDDFNRMAITVIQSAYADLQADWFAESVLSPFSRLYLVESGEGFLFCGDETIVMKPQHMYLIPPGVRFSYRCEVSLKKLYFHISILKPSGYDLLQELGCIAELKMPAGLLPDMIARHRSGKIADALLLKRDLYDLIGLFLEQYRFSSRETEQLSEPVQKAIRYVQRNLSVKLRVEEIAKELFVSRSFLSNRFHAEMGVTIGKYIDDQILFSAQWRLERTNDSLAAISDSLGFCDQFYFSRRFKQRSGETPLEYRRKSRRIR